MKGRSEARLCVERMSRMLGPRPGRVLLVGEAEGMLARLLAAAGWEVAWLEPGGEDEPGAAGAGADPGSGGTGAYPGSGVAGSGPGSVRGEVGFAGAAAGPGATRRLAGDPLRLPFPDASYDAVASQFALDHLEDPGAALAEWERVLRKGGTLALAARNGLFRGPEQRPRPRPARAFTPGTLRELVVGAGFEVTEVSSLVPYLRLAALYRGDLSFCLALERIPMLRLRGRTLFLRAAKRGVGRP